MKDSTYELIHAIVTLLGSTLTYNSYIFDVYEDLPNNEINNYVWFPSAALSDESSQDQYRQEVLLTIEVVTRSMKQKASRQAIVAIGTKILTALIGQNISMTNFEVSEFGMLTDIMHGSAYEEQGGLTLTGSYTIRIVTQQK